MGVLALVVVGEPLAAHFSILYFLVHHFTSTSLAAVSTHCIANKLAMQQNDQVLRENTANSVVWNNWLSFNMCETAYLSVCIFAL